MIFEGSMSVIDAIKEKKRLMEEGKEHRHIQPLLVIDGGLMKGAYGAGAVIAMEEMGLSAVFENVVGISSGAPTASYFVAGEVQKGVQIYFEEACTRAFINPWRIWNQVDTLYFAGALRGVTGKGIDTDKVFASHTKLYIGVANFQTGTPKLLKPKTGEELFTAVQASILMPNVSSDVVRFNDIRYVDGGFTRPHILRIAIDEIKATHVLILTNQDKTVSIIPLLERFLNHTLFRWRMPKALRFAAHERRRERLKVLVDMEENYGKPYALVWGNHSIRGTERNSDVVKSVVEKSRLWWHALLKDR
ncbi:MAG: putative patatin/cPLA2 family phospholipase [Patiriisocius sp.]|jgi:predicted patatin/cPLA2 family phospholipase